MTNEKDACDVKADLCDEVIVEVHLEKYFNVQMQLDEIVAYGTLSRSCF